MKKRLLVALLSLSMVFCLMPTMAFAGEVDEPTEEPKVEEQAPEEEEAVEEKQVVEQPVVEESKGELAAPTVVDEEKTAELAGRNLFDVSGAWDGYKYIITVGEGASQQDKDYIYNNGVRVKVNGTETAVSVENGVINFTNIVNDVFEKATNICNISVYLNGRVASPGSVELNASRIYGSTAFFCKLDTQVNVSEAASKDTTFTYGIDSYVDEVFEGSALKLERSSKYAEEEGDVENPHVELVEDKIVLKKGETSVNDKLVMRLDFKARMNVMNRCTMATIIGEKENDGNYKTSEELWAVVVTDMLGRGEYKQLYLKGFANSEELNAFIEKTNKSITEKKGEIDEFKFLNTEFTADTLSFNHTVLPTETVATTTKKGVNTGDSNELGLWLAIGMLASVACAAYALKRREN